jgi:hypothetical protein
MKGQSAEITNTAVTLIPSLLLQSLLILLLVIIIIISHEDGKHKCMCTLFTYQNGFRPESGSLNCNSKQFWCLKNCRIRFNPLKSDDHLHVI